MQKIYSMKINGLKICFIVVLLFQINFLLGDDIKILNKVEQYFNGVKTLSTEFTQFTISEKHKMSTGRLCIMKPGMLRLDYMKPKKLTIILRDDHIMYYNHELDEISYIKKNNYFFQLLLEKNIEFQDEAKKIHLMNHEINLKFEKILDNVNTNIDMTFAKNPITLKRVEIIQSDSEKYLLTFDNTEYNVYLDKKLFSIQNPKFYSAPY